MREATRVFLLALMVAADPRIAGARQRQRFEPTDLEMEKAGQMEVDLQVGALRGEGPWRVVVPDIEIDLGLAEDIELDIDGAYAVEGATEGPFSLDHPAPDNLWIAAKLGLYDSREEHATSRWAIGAQLGPKLPVANDAHGIGYEALLLVGHTLGESHLVLNLGGLVDPGARVSAARPTAIEGGLDLDLQLGRSPISITGELSAVHFFSADVDQLNATGGVTLAASDDLDFSLIGLVGFLRGGDRGGILLGVSPKFSLWK